MTFAVLTTRCTLNSQVRDFHLCASKDLETRIINVASHDLGLKLQSSNDGDLVLKKGMIPLHKLLSWIKSSGYEFRSTMIFALEGYGKICYEKYVFEERGK